MTTPGPDHLYLMPKRKQMLVKTVSALIPLYLLFIFITCSVRLPFLDMPLGRGFDLNTAFLMTVMEVWRSDGIVKHDFTPSFTYPGKINKNVVAYSSLNHLDPEGKTHYMSVPPLTFITVYFAMNAVGAEINEMNIRIFSIIFFWIIALILNIFLLKVLSLFEKPGAAFFVSAVLLTVFHISEMSLWYQGTSLVFESISILFFLLTIICSQNFLDCKTAKIFDGLALFVCSALLSYSDWTGVFYAVAGAFLCLSNRKNQRYAQHFWIVFSGMATALAVCIIQFALVIRSDFFSVACYWLHRMSSRVAGEGAAHTIGIYNHLISYLGAAKTVLSYHLSGYSGSLSVMCVLFLACLIFRKRFSAPFEVLRGNWVIVYFSLVPAILWMVILLQATAAHNFFILKNNIFISIIVAIFAQSFFRDVQSIDSRKVKVVAIICFVVFLAASSAMELRRYCATPYNTDVFKKIGQFIRTKTRSDQMVFLKFGNPEFTSNYLINYEIDYYAKRNIATWVDKEASEILMKKNAVNSASVYGMAMRNGKVMITKIGNFDLPK